MEDREEYTTNSKPLKQLTWEQINDSKWDNFREEYLSEHPDVWRNEDQLATVYKVFEYLKERI